MVKDNTLAGLKLLRFQQKAQSEDVMLLSFGEKKILGSSLDCDLVIKDNSVSKKHAILEKKKNNWYIYDYGSTNGIWVNQKEYNKKKLKDGDIIELGNTKIKFFDNKKTIFSYKRFSLPIFLFFLFVFISYILVFSQHKKDISKVIDDKLKYHEKIRAQTQVLNVDFETILNNISAKNSLFFYGDTRNILVIDFESLKTQGRCLNRVLALVELPNHSRKNIISFEKLNESIRKTGFTTDTIAYGHDFRDVDLIKFFNLARKQKVTLSNDENWLKKKLLENEIIKQVGGIYYKTDKDKALVTIAQTQEDNPVTFANEKYNFDMRKAVLMHELSHGEFFTNKDFREYCFDYWDNKLTKDERELIKKFMAKNLYDPKNKFLVVNEMQAFLFHTPSKAFFSKDSLGISKQELTDLRVRFLEDNPPCTLLKTRGLLFRNLGKN